MDNNYKDLTPKGPAAPGLHPIRHKEFNEFIKGKGFKGRNNYKLKDLKAMFGFKSMITGSPVTISSHEFGTNEIRFYIEGFNFYKNTIPYPSIC